MHHCTMHMPFRAPNFWIWTPKIIPDLWLNAVFCPIKKNLSTLPQHYLLCLISVKCKNMRKFSIAHLAPTHTHETICPFPLTV